MKIEFMNGKVIDIPLEDEKDFEREFLERFEKNPQKTIEEIMVGILALQHGSYSAISILTGEQRDVETYNNLRTIPTVRRIVIGDVEIEVEPSEAD